MLLGHVIITFRDYSADIDNFVPISREDVDTPKTSSSAVFVLALTLNFGDGSVPLTDVRGGAPPLPRRLRYTRQARNQIQQKGTAKTMLPSF